MFARFISKLISFQEKERWCAGDVVNNKSLYPSPFFQFTSQY